MRQQRQQFNQPGPGIRQAGDFLRRLDKQLQLSVPQRERIAAILKESQERTRHIYGKVEPQMRDELRLTRERIKSELAPSQAALFEKLQGPNSQRKKEEVPFRDPRWDHRRDAQEHTGGQTNPSVLAPQP
jgi:hypothetical protein